VHEDVFRAMGYVSVVTVENVNMRNHQSLHPDLFDFASGWTQRNCIFEDVVILGALGQGVAGANVEDIAFVRCNVTTPGWNVMQMDGAMRHVLFDQVTMTGGASIVETTPGGVVIRGSSIGYKEPFLPDGYTKAGVYVF